MFFIYIIYSKEADKYYVGQTENIEDRLISHRSGISKYTSISDDWVLLYSESFQTRTEAVRRGREIKRKRAEIEWLFLHKLD